MLFVSVAAPTGAQAANDYYGLLPQEGMSASDVATVKAGGIESIRLAVSRDWVSQKPGSYNWTDIDTVVRNAANNGISILPTFYGSARWESDNFKLMPTSSTALADWTSMLKAAVQRYGPTGSFWQMNPTVPKKPISIWQIWNEVNTVWFTKSVDPADYAKLVIESSKAIRSQDPDAKVMLSGLFATPSPAAGMEADDYLNALYQVDGFRTSFDFAAIHPYEKTVTSAINEIKRVRKILDDWRNDSKGIYVTEMGWGSDWRPGLGTGSTAAQALRLTEAYTRLQAIRTNLKIKAVYWFTWKDLPEEAVSCGFCYKIGLFDVFRVPKPAWTALVEVIKQDPATPTPTPEPTPTPTPEPTPTPQPTIISPEMVKPSTHQVRCPELKRVAGGKCRYRRACRNSKAAKSKRCRTLLARIERCSRKTGRSRSRCWQRSSLDRSKPVTWRVRARERAADWPPFLTP